MIPETLAKQRQDYIDAVRQWCRDQVELWWQLPYWEIMQDSRHDWLPYPTAIYVLGLQRVNIEHEVYREGYVDLETGELLSGESTTSLCPMTDDEVFSLRLADLDAQHRIDCHKAYDPDFGGGGRMYPNDLVAMRSRRAQKLARYGVALGQPYRRPIHQGA